MIPVPGAAGLSSTRPAPNSPMICVRDRAVLVSGTLNMFFFASSMPFLMATGTSCGLAHADADVAVAVTDDHQRGQREATATLDDLRRRG